MNKPVIYRDIFSFASVPVFICYWHLVVISLKLNVATNARSVWVKCGPGGSIGDPVQLSPTPIGDPVQLFRDPAQLHPGPGITEDQTIAPGCATPGRCNLA